MADYSLKTLQDRLLFETKQSNAYRLNRSFAKTAKEKKGWQTLIDLAEQSKDLLREKITNQKSTMKTPAKTPVKKPAKKRLKGLSRVPVCTRRNIDGSHTSYSQQGGTNPCPYGGGLNGAKKPAARKRIITAKKLCSKVIRREGLKVDGTLKKGYHYTRGGKIVKAKAAPKKPVKKK